MSDERFGIGGVVDDGVWTATPIYLDSLIDTAVDSPTDGFVLTYEASSGKWKPTAAGAGADTKTEVYEAGVQVGTVARAINFDGDDFNVTEEAGPGYFTITFAGTGMTAHDMTGAYHTEDATGGVGNVIRATGATTFAWATLAHGDLSDAPTDVHHTEIHALAVTGPHTGTLPLTDLAVGSLGSLIRRGAADWEELGLGTQNYVLKAGATQFDWGQVDYSELTGTQPDPVAHVLSGALHTASGLSVGDAIMADSATTFSWQTPSYYSSFTTDFAAESLANLTTRAHSDLSDEPTDAHHNETHVLAVTGPHSGSLPWADMAAGTQGGIIRRGAADWEEYALGTTDYVLKAGATDVAWGQVDYSELTGTQPDPVAHVLATTGPHSDTLPLTDLAVGSQGSMIRRGAADWEELGLGTTTYVLKAGATDIDWGQVDYSELTGTQPNPVAHTLAGALHTATGLTVGWVIAADSATTFSWQAPSGGTDDDAIHDNVAQEIQPITGKGSPVGADVILIEDSADSWNKKSVTITNLPGGADADAIHDNVDNEIQPITPKGAPVGADVVLIEDSAASWAKKSVLISNLPAGSPSFGVPSGNIDIGDAAAEGSSGDSTRADHQHQFSAPGVGYPLDVANSEADGTATTPARSDHVHAHGTITSASAHRWNDIAAMPDTTTITIGKATPTAVVLGVGHNGTSAYVNTFYIADHAHTTTAGSGNQVDYTDLANIPGSFTPAAHVLAVTGPHTGELPWADMAVGTQGGIVRRGAADWEEYALGTEDYVLKATATDAVWGQVDFSELTGSVPSHGASEHSAESDAEAIHDNVDGEINAIGVKGTPIGADILVIEDSAATWAKKKITISTLPAGSPSFGVPTGNIDIGDAAVEGTSGDATRADHQHQFSAPGAGYPLDTANTEADGTATTPARSDHVHALGAHLHSATAGEGGTLTWANALAVAAAGDHAHSSNIAGGTLTWVNVLAVATAGDHDHSDNTKGNVVPEGSVTFADAGHAHTGTTGGSTLDWDTCWADAVHDHSTTAEGGEIPVASLANGTQYQVLRAGVTDPAFADEEFTKGGVILSPVVGFKTIWIAPFACTITLLRGRQKGGTNTVINARVNGTGQVGTSDLTLVAADTSYSTASLTTTAIASGEFLEIEVVTVASATEILIQLDITRP